MQTEGIGRFKISKNPVRNLTQNLSCSSAMPQTTVLIATCEKCAKKNCKNGKVQLIHCEYTSYRQNKQTVSCVAVQTQAQSKMGNLQKYNLFLHGNEKGGWIGWHVWKLKTNSRCRKCKEPAQMTCVTNPIYLPYSKISSAWIPLVSKEVSKREIQVDLMCSLLFLILLGAPFFFHIVSNDTGQYVMSKFPMHGILWVGFWFGLIVIVLHLPLNVKFLCIFPQFALYISYCLPLRRFNPSNFQQTNPEVK